MLRRFSSKVAKTYFKFSTKNKDGILTPFRIIDLTEELVDKFIEFQINHFVPNELSHQIAGIPYSKEALNEYKYFLRKTCINPPFYNVVCCPEIDGEVIPEIVASCTVQLHAKHDPLDFSFEAKTDEVRKLFKISYDWDKWCPVTDVMEKYGVENVLDYLGATVHPDYYQRGIGNKICFIRHDLSEELNAGLCIAWTTAEGTAKIGVKNGWNIEYKIESEQVAKLYNTTFQNPPKYFYYLVYKI